MYHIHELDHISTQGVAEQKQNKIMGISQGYITVHLVWGLLIQIVCSIIFPFFQNYQYTVYVLNITFIFERCHCSSAAVTPVRYECDWKDVPFLHQNITNREINEWQFSDTPPLPRPLEILYNSTCCCYGGQVQYYDYNFLRRLWRCSKHVIL